MKFKHIREIFTFTSRERNGLVILVTLLMSTVLWDFSIPYILPHTDCDVTAWKQEAEKYYAAVPLEKANEPVMPEAGIDPNRPGQTELLQLGLPAGLVSNWMKYLRKGGRFKKKEELLKLYGMTAECYQKLARFLVIPDETAIQMVKTDHAKANRIVLSSHTDHDSLPDFRKRGIKLTALLDLNKADSAALEALPGIGPVLASRIIKYRRILGGYCGVVQLKEIYGMSDELWLKCSPRLTADSSGVKKLNINFLSVVELGRHPYIGFRQAKKIAKIRDTNGKFKLKEEFSAVFSADSLNRLLPYLSVSSSEQ
jgi:competence protein ComEA